MKDNKAEVVYLEEWDNKTFRKSEKKVYTEIGKTILQISLENDIPHTHACGGNGKCTTCRVLVIAGEEHLSERNGIEERIARKKGFGKKERLACQTKVFGNIKIKRIVKDSLDEEVVLSAQKSGKEMAIAILFADLRNFTAFTERHLAYDVVYALNRFYKRVGDAILNHEGYIDKFIGDGVLALFGLDDTDSKKKCENALSSAIEIVEKVEEINKFFNRFFGEEFRIGIGLHFGVAIVGDIGHPAKRQLTAIGDAVNFASRLEKMTKHTGEKILVSEEFAKILDNKEILNKEYLVQIRGKSGSYKVYSLHLSKKPYTSIRNLIKEHMPRTLSPIILRLVFHDVMSGGSFTSNFHDDYRIGLELQKPINRNLESGVEFIKQIKEKVKGEPYSYRDILYLAGAVAVEISGGPFINIVVPAFSDRSFLEAGIPVETESFGSYFEKFRKLNLTKKDVVALMGAHTLGRANDKPFTENLFRFDNEYFRRLLFYREDENLNSLLYTDWQLLEDEECKRYVELYAYDVNAFYEDFREAYLKLIQFAF